MSLVPWFDLIVSRRIFAIFSGHHVPFRPVFAVVGVFGFDVYRFYRFCGTPRASYYGDQCVGDVSRAQGVELIHREGR
jgi:hypothetical protein